MNKDRFSPAPIVYVALLMLPLYWLLIMSFKTNGEIMGAMTFIPHSPTLDNFRVMFSDSAWTVGYLNAFIYVAINVVISISVALPAAYAFSRYNFPGNRLLLFCLLMFRMMAPVVLLVPFVQIFSDLQLFDTHIAVALAHCFFNIPLAIWILEGFISAIPREIDESAAIDGYRLPRFLVRILLPMLAPGVAVTAFFCFMFSWIEHLLSNALTAVYAKPIGGIMTRAGGVLAANMSLLSAASVLSILPGIVLIIFMRNHLARGFSLGRVV